MCRLFALASTRLQGIERWVIDEPHALLRQSCGDRRGECHEDGWGIGSYVSDQPHVVRSVLRAAEDDTFIPNVRAVHSTIAMAHVRQASVGVADVNNNHPFTFGRWMLMHNGTVEKLEHFQSRIEAELGDEWLQHRQGTTDSQLTFLLLLARMQRAGVDLPSPPEDLAPLLDVLRQTIYDLADWSAAAPGPDSERGASKLNFVLSDGRRLFLTRWQHDLHLCSLDGETTLVASEPIGSVTWQELPEPSIAIIEPGRAPILVAL